MLARGKRIKVYQKPLSDEDFEDTGVLVRATGGVRDGGGYESWLVEFDDGTLSRVVHPRNLVD